MEKRENRVAMKESRRQAAGLATRLCGRFRRRLALLLGPKVNHNTTQRPAKSQPQARGT
jgi:hypothetical protein